MKSIKTNVHERIERPYPKLMQYNDNTTFVLLMYGESDGIVVYHENANILPVGTHSNHWPSGELVDFEGSITLSND